MTNAEWVSELYRAILGRSAEGAGAEYWINALNAGIHTQPSAYQAFINSPEGQAALRKRISDAYQAALGREAEPAGVDYWMSQISSGALGPDQATITARIRTTPEGQIYRTTPTGQGTGTATGGAGTVTPAPAQRSVSFELETILARYDLQGLSGFLQDMMVNSDASIDEVMIKLYDHPDFKARFPAIQARQAAGLAPISPEEYIQYEKQAHELFRAAGLPSQFYDSREDFTDFLTQNVSTAELSARIQQGYQRAITAPTEVRAKYAEWFGVNGDAALAANFLDPNKALPLLEQELMSAEVGGYGSIFGVNVAQSTATKLASMGYDGRSSMQGFRQIQGQDSLFTESITETQDFTAEGEGIGAAFGLDQDAAQRLERRAVGRRAALSGGGGLMATEAGLAGRAE